MKGTSIKEELHQTIAVLPVTTCADADDMLIESPNGEAGDAQEFTSDGKVAARLGSAHPWLSEICIEDRWPR